MASRSEVTTPLRATRTPAPRSFEAEVAKRVELGALWNDIERGQPAAAVIDVTGVSILDRRRDVKGAGQEYELGDRVVEMALPRSEPGHGVVVVQTVAGNDRAIGGVNAEHELHVLDGAFTRPRQPNSQWVS